MPVISLNLSNEQIALLDAWKSGKGADDYDVGQVILAGVRALEQISASGCGLYLVSYSWKDHFGHMMIENTYHTFPEGPTEDAIEEFQKELYARVKKDKPSHQTDRMSAPRIWNLIKLKDSPTSDLAKMAIAIAAEEQPSEDTTDKRPVVVTYAGLRYEFQVPATWTARQVVDCKEVREVLGNKEGATVWVNGETDEGKPLRPGQQLLVATCSGEEGSATGGHSIRAQFNGTLISFKVAPGTTAEQFANSPEAKAKFPSIPDKFVCYVNGRQTGRVLAPGDLVTIIRAEELPDTFSIDLMVLGKAWTKHKVKRGTLASQLLKEEIFLSTFGLTGKALEFSLNGSTVDGMLEVGSRMSVRTAQGG